MSDDKLVIVRLLFYELIQDSILHAFFKANIIDFNFVIVCVSSTGIQIVEPKVELWFAIPFSTRKKAEVSSLYIYHSRHCSYTCIAAAYHICVLQGSDSLPHVKGRKEKQKAEHERFVPCKFPVYGHPI